MCCTDKFKVMKKIFCVFCAAALLFQACSEKCANQDSADGRIPDGGISVMLKYDSSVSRGVSDYDFVLDEEARVNDIQILVFDSMTGVLQRSAEMDSVDDRCEFAIPVGSKTVYALVNGPDVSKVRTLDALLEMTDDLSDRNYMQDGFVMIGSGICDVESGETARPVIKVGRLVSRVVLRSVTCNIAKQYEAMTVDCVFLGNAALECSMGGESSGRVNVGGYEDDMKSEPVGLSGVTGVCPEYLYRSMGCGIRVGQEYDQPVCMYCYPNETDDYTCLYMLATIGQQKYYYRVPLDKGLVSNVTCAVDVTITNLGAPLPPDGVLQKGEIVATVSIEGWSMGHLYNAEF